MAIRKPVDEPVNHERWLVSYADFITLLFAFFVVMYSISQVNDSKYRVLSDSLTDTFQNPQSAIDLIDFGESNNGNPDNIIALNGDGPLESQDAVAQANTGDSDQDSQVGELGSQIEERFAELLNDNLITVTGNENWLEVELKSSLLFDSGEAELKTAAAQLLAEIANLLRQQNSPIRVEGYTDDVPINTRQFPSNWVLSTARAAAVIELFAEQGLAPDQMAAVGYGEHQPIVANSSPENRARNRRVVLLISKNGNLRPELPRADTSGAGSTSSQIEDSGKPLNPGDVDGVKTVELEGGGLLFTSETPP